MSVSFSSSFPSNFKILETSSFSHQRGQNKEQFSQIVACALQFPDITAGQPTDSASNGGRLFGPKRVGNTSISALLQLPN